MANSNHITAALLREYIHYDPDTGVFTRIKPHQGARLGPVKLWVHSDGYVRFISARRNLYAHRMAWLYTTGEYPVNLVDHIDGDRTNNRWANLRSADRRLNRENMRSSMSGKNGGLPLGVFIHSTKKGVNSFKWVLNTRGVRIGGGLFTCPHQAHAEYVEAKRMWHEGCTI